MIIYVLKHPLTNAIRYIGKTAYSLEYRLKYHLEDDKSKARWTWICELRAAGLIPIIECIYEYDEDIEPRAEMDLIVFYKKIGVDLLNCHYNR